MNIEDKSFFMTIIMFLLSLIVGFAWNNWYIPIIMWLTAIYWILLIINRNINKVSDKNKVKRGHTQRRTKTKKWKSKKR
jgi:preprotein translocase subunit SecG